MAQILDPLPPDQSNHILCCYINQTSKIQVARITNVPNWYFERVVFPGQHLVFEALADAQLEIHTGMMASAILSDKISCLRLKIDEGSTEPEDDSTGGSGSAETTTPANLPSPFHAQRASASRSARYADPSAQPSRPVISVSMA